MTADKELATFIGKYSSEVASVAKAALVKMRKRLPGAIELVWDNYNALAIAFGSSEKRARTCDGCRKAHTLRHDGH